MAAAGVLIITACAAHVPTVTHNYAPGTNFTAFKTDGWIELPNADQPDRTVDEQVRTAIEKDPLPHQQRSGGLVVRPVLGMLVVGNAQYSHQFDVSGGITFRF
jgi:hypothetical protein